MPKSREEIDELKRQWKRDPCWDIYDTEGFEDHREELEKWQEEYQKSIELEMHQMLASFAEKIGVPGNIELAKCIDRMMDRIATLEQKLEERTQP